MTITRRFVELDRCRISYLTAGDGAAAQPILLIHGSGMSAGSWVNQLLGLSATFRVTAIDLPGHGKSTAIPHASVETYAATVARFLEAIGARRVIVAGHSLGGSVAIALAARQPDAVTGLVLVASCAKLPRAETPGERWLAFLPGPFRRMLFFTMAQKLLFAPGAPSGALDIGMNELHACSTETIRKDVDAARAMDVTHSAAAINVPALVLCGSRDRLTPPVLSQDLATLIPRSQLGIIEGAGHMLLLEAPELLNQAIVEFAVSLKVEVRSSVLARELRGVSLIRRLLDRARSRTPQTA